MRNSVSFRDYARNGTSYDITQFFLNVRQDLKKYPIFLIFFFINHPSIKANKIKNIKLVEAFSSFFNEKPNKV